MARKIGSFLGSMLSTWIGGLFAVVLLLPPAIWTIIFVLKCMLAGVYALNGQAPAGWEGPFE